MSNKILKIFRNLAIFLVIFGMVFSNIPFYILSGMIEGYVKTSNIVDRAWQLSQNDNVVDNFTSWRNVAEQIKVQEAQAATITFVGSASNSSVPTADTTVSLTGISLQAGDLVIVTAGIGDDDNVNHNVLINTAGYTEVADLFANDTDDTNLAVWWKIMGATPDASVVVE